jgi:hypothetical protein
MTFIGRFSRSHGFFLSRNAGYGSLRNAVTHPASHPKLNYPAAQAGKRLALPAKKRDKTVSFSLQ